jgi:hypothetical protein
MKWILEYEGTCDRKMEQLGACEEECWLFFLKNLQYQHGLFENLVANMAKNYSRFGSAEKPVEGQMQERKPALAKTNTVTLKIPLPECE